MWSPFYGMPGVPPPYPMWTVNPYASFPNPHMTALSMPVAPPVPPQPFFQQIAPPASPAAQQAVNPQLAYRDVSQMWPGGQPVPGSFAIPAAPNPHAYYYNGYMMYSPGYQHAMEVAGGPGPASQPGPIVQDVTPGATAIPSATVTQEPVPTNVGQPSVQVAPAAQRALPVSQTPTAPKVAEPPPVRPTLPTPAAATVTQQPVPTNVGQPSVQVAPAAQRALPVSQTPTAPKVAEPPPVRPTLPTPAAAQAPTPTSSKSATPTRTPVLPPFPKPPESISKQSPLPPQPLSIPSATPTPPPFSPPASKESSLTQSASVDPMQGETKGERSEDSSAISARKRTLRSAHSHAEAQIPLEAVIADDDLLDREVDEPMEGQIQEVESGPETEATTSAHLPLEPKKMKKKKKTQASADKVYAYWCKYCEEPTGFVKRGNYLNHVWDVHQIRE